MLNCYIIDDELPAINILKSYVQKTPNVALVGYNTNALEALPLIKKEQIDVLFLDIQMPDITGIEFLQLLQNPPMVIFTTAYEAYALQGYELDILDYLVKPIPFTRFLKGIDKAKRFHQKTVATLPKAQFLYVKADYQTVKIPFETILYIEGLKDYVKIYTTEKMVLTRLNLKGIGEKLPSDQFVRVHRSYIIALSKITAFTKSQLTIEDNQIPIGNAYQIDLLKKLG